MTGSFFRSPLLLLLVASACAQAQQSESAAQPETSRVNFSDGFEREPSPWSGTSVTAKGTCSYDAPTITSELTHSGKYAAKAEFDLEPSKQGAMCNGIEPNPHQDKNIYYEKVFEPGLKRFTIAAWFYIKKPVPKDGGNHAQKFFYLLANGNSPRFVVATDYDEFAKKPSVYISYNTGAGGSHSLYGDDSEVKPKDKGSVNGIVNLPFEEWFYLEFAVDYKTAEKTNDAAIHLYYATDKEPRREVFRKTKHWTAENCGGSDSRGCPAFPDDVALDKPIREFRIGAQVDRQQDRTVHEVRYWDDVTISGE